MVDSTTPFRCVIHGSFRKHFSEIANVCKLFKDAGLEVLAPKLSNISNIKNGFIFLDTDKYTDPRYIELLYLRNLKRLGENGFSYFVNPEGYIGKSVSYELGIAQLSNIRCFFSEKPNDHPVYTHHNSLWTPENLIQFILEHHALPQPDIKPNERKIHELWESLMVPGSVVAVGGIIEYAGIDAKKEKDVLLVKTHKWGGKYSMVGGKVRRNERLDEALSREVEEETGLRGKVGSHVCTFDQIKNSGYYLSGVQHIFVDKVFQTSSRTVRLNEEAQEYIWVPPSVALCELSIEPNARHTLQMYASALK